MWNNPADTKKNKIYRRKRFWAGVLLAQFLLFFLLSKSDAAVKLAEHFFEFQKAFHQKLFSLFPFSVGDLLYVLLGIYLIFILFKIFKKSSRQKYLFKGFILLNILYFSYQIFWGLLYFQQPLIEKLPKEEPTLEEAKQLALKYLEICKKDRELVKEDKNGVFKVFNLKNIESEILQNQNQLPKLVTEKKGTQINSFKTSLYKGVMSYTGILGYYNPFTAEAQYNEKLPSSYLSFTLAHESAHQLGFAREQEANFIGYLIAKNSTNAELKYSTDYFVLKSLLNALVEKNPEFVKSAILNYSEGMKRDRLYEKMFFEKHSGLLDAFFGFTNDLFLKTNQQEGSITYSYFVDLLIRYERENP